MKSLLLSTLQRRDSLHLETLQPRTWAAPSEARTVDTSTPPTGEPLTCLFSSLAPSLFARRLVVLYETGPGARFDRDNLLREGASPHVAAAVPRRANRTSSQEDSTIASVPQSATYRGCGHISHPTHRGRTGRGARRLRGGLAEDIEQQHLVYIRASTHTAGCLQTPATGKDRQPTEQPALRFAQELVAPVHRRAEGR